MAILSALPAVEVAGDLASYMGLREQVKQFPLPALEAIAASSQAQRMKRGIAAYYAFLQIVSAGPAPAQAHQAILALEAATAETMDPSAYTKLSVIYSDSFPELGISQDTRKSLKYLSISWELGELAVQATGSNELLTLILSGNLGLGDELFAQEAGTPAQRKAAVDAIRAEVLAAREQFKRFVSLESPDQNPGSLAIERHYLL